MQQTLKIYIVKKLINFLYQHKDESRLEFLFRKKEQFKPDNVEN